MIVVLAILGILAGVVPLTIGGAASFQDADPATSRISAARRDALRLRHPVSVEVVVDSVARWATVMPDGRVIGDAALGGQRMSVIANAR